MGGGEAGVGVPKLAQDPGEKPVLRSESDALSFPGGICQIPKLARKKDTAKKEKGQSSIFCTSVVLRQLKTEVRNRILREKAN